MGLDKTDPATFSSKSKLIFCKKYRSRLSHYYSCSLFCFLSTNLCVHPTEARPLSKPEAFETKEEIGPFVHNDFIVENSKRPLLVVMAQDFKISAAYGYTCIVSSIKIRHPRVGRVYSQCESTTFTSKCENLLTDIQSIFYQGLQVQIHAHGFG